MYELFSTQFWKSIVIVSYRSGKDNNFLRKQSPFWTIFVMIQKFKRCVAQKRSTSSKYYLYVFHLLQN